MRRAAIFVDAGYFYSQASYSAFGSNKPRSAIFGNESHLVDAAMAFAREVLPADTELLRTFWYDAAADGLPTPSQASIGNLPAVKLRLGRLVNSRQKGVDALIVKDLMVLAQERTITHAFLLSGDEDLRDGVLYAQDRGVVVWLLGIKGNKGASLSSALAREADYVSTALTEAAIEAVTQPELHRMSTERRVRIAIDEFIGHLDVNALNALLQQPTLSAPRIPHDVDSSLMNYFAGHVFPETDIDGPARSIIRRAFWEEVDRRRT